MTNNQKKDHVLDIYLKLDNKMASAEEMIRAIRLLHISNDQVMCELKKSHIERKECEAWKRRIAYNYARIRNLNNNLKMIDLRNAKNEKRDEIVE